MSSSRSTTSARRSSSKRQVHRPRASTISWTHSLNLTAATPSTTSTSSPRRTARRARSSSSHGRWTPNVQIFALASQLLNWMNFSDNIYMHTFLTESVWSSCSSVTVLFFDWKSDLWSLRSPSVSRIRAKMLYATSKERFRRELDGVHYEIQATDPSELDIELLRERAHWEKSINQSLGNNHHLALWDICNSYYICYYVLKLAHCWGTVVLLQLYTISVEVRLCKYEKLWVVWLRLIYIRLCFP